MTLLFFLLLIKKCSEVHIMYAYIYLYGYTERHEYYLTSKKKITFLG